MKSALLKATVLSAGIAASLTVVDFQPANAAGFSGDYDPIFWGLGNVDADGSVDETGAPGSITLFGGNDGSGLQGNTLYGTTLAGSIASYVSFDWAYGSFDDA
ncbi:MAG: PEP-CTERM sorting domain-containing protein, partial [Nodosilinea sp.]